MDVLPVHLSILLLFVTSILCFPLQEIVNLNHTVVVFAFSGLRWDSTERFNMPALEKMKREGVYVQRKTDPFQTESLPSFVTMVTGKFPDSHGMVSNEMRDMETFHRFDVSSTDPKWWKQVKPIWITNQENGNTSALCYWPGHQILFNGSKVSYSCYDYKYVDPFQELLSKGEITNVVMPFEERVEKVKAWLSVNHTHRPSFIAVYFEEPLRSILKYGFGANATKAAFEAVNNVTKNMMDFLCEKKLCDNINFVVTGESGVTDLGKDDNGEDLTIFLDDYLTGEHAHLRGNYQVVDNGPITTVYARGNDQEMTKQLLKIWANASDNMTAYNGSNLPVEFHYTTKHRTMPIILVANEGYRIIQGRVVSPNKAMMGYHGKYKSSQALLIAKGPAFKEGYFFDKLPNVDVYSMLCKALKITPEENSGKEENIKNAMKTAGKWYVVIIKNVVKSPTWFTVVIIVGIVVIVGIVGIVIYCRCFYTIRYIISLQYSYDSIKTVISKATEKCRWN